MDLLLAPHNDDETLFCAYTLLRLRPLVVVCLRSAGGYGAAEVREAESAAACALLGCGYVQFPHPDAEPDWELVERDLRRLRPRCDPYSRVFAPAPEPLGQEQHNRIGELALRLWPGQVTLYLTYTKEGKSDWGDPVHAERGWPELKRVALADYASQIADPRTAPHFTRPLDEFYAPAGYRSRISSARS